MTTTKEVRVVMKQIELGLGITPISAPGSRALGLGVDVEVRTTENLFVDFLATLSGGLDADAEPNVEKTLDNVADFEQLVDEHVLRLQRVIEKQSSRVQKQNSVATQVKTNLVVERNSWRLIGKLFADRLLVNFGEDGDHEMVADDRITMKSEKRIAEKLFQRERSLRQAQAIVDWLEQNAKDTLEDEFRQTDFFGDLLVGWENTLHALRMGSGDERRMVTELDPDARSRQKKPLHDLDEQDQSRLVKAIYLCIRSGMLDNAQDLCVRLGQPWRAATLIGWKLCHDPNYESTDCTEKHPVEGNASRDVWKRSAWVLTEDAALSAQEKAIYSALCGNSGQLLRSGVCRSWEDYMWALVRSMVDVKVEQEIRATMVRSFSELPKRYWENLSDLEAILNSLVSVESKEVREEVATPHRILQRFIMLEEWDSLNKYLLDCTTGENQVVLGDPHFVRFLCHLVLVLRRLKVPLTPEATESVIVCYIRYLVSADRPQQVAWYSSQISRELQIEVYSDFLKTLSNDTDKKMCLTLAEENGLPLYEIRLKTVVDILAMEDSEERLGDQHLSREDDLKIGAINFLLLEPVEKEDALIQTNALVRYFVASQKLEAAKIALNNIAPHLKGAVEETSEDDTKEFLCLQSYVMAKEAFSDWFEYLHKGKPIEPSSHVEANSFTSQIATEQKEKQYKQDLDRWHGALLVQSREVCSLLLAILKFPNGWLVCNVQGDKQKNRPVEMEYIRKTCIMEVVLLLHSVYHSTRQYKEALQLADLVSSEQRALYRAFNKEDMKKFLLKLKESSVAMMETSDKDALGY